MAEKTLNSRVIQKHDTEANWLKAANFKPKAGEVIIYDADENYSYPRIKIGDGNTLVNELPFAATRPDWNAAEGEEGYIENKPNVVKSVNGVVPDENGEIKTDYVCKAAFYVSGGKVTCDKTFLELYNAILKPKVCATEFIYIDNSVSPYSRFELTHIDQPTVPKNSGSGIKVINICHFGDTVAPIIIDPETQTFYLDPDWVAPAEPVKTLNGIAPDENGNIQTDIAFPVLITHLKFPMFDDIKCNKTCQELEHGFLTQSTEASSIALLLYTAEPKSEVYYYCENFLVDKNGLDGGIRFILDFGKGIRPYIVDVNANTIALDPDWIAPAEPIKTVNGVSPDENGNAQVPTVDVIQFIDASGFGGGIQCNKTIEEAYSTSTGAGVLVVYRRIWVGSNDGNPSDAYTSTIYRDSKAGKLTIDFNDGRAPIVVDANNNTITLDPNWVAPLANINSINGILPDADGNVQIPQPDWDETDETSLAFIKNKPEAATDEEIIDMMLSIDMMPVVQDADGSILVDSDEAILMI